MLFSHNRANFFMFFAKKFKPEHTGSGTMCVMSRGFISLKC